MGQLLNGVMYREAWDQHGVDTFRPNNISACQNMLTGYVIEAV